MLTIGEVARRADLPASTIRYYEQLGLLAPAARVGGKRVYSNSVLKRLAVIEVAKAAGFELHEIGAMLKSVQHDGPSKTWHRSARTKQAAIEAQMRTLARMREILEGLQSCGCATLEECGAAFITAIANEPLDTPVKPEAVRRVSATRFSRAMARGRKPANG
jgi:MerR family redox-sensitive transcriptional activator SoxR